MFSWFKFDWLKSRPEPVEVKEEEVGEQLASPISIDDSKPCRNILYSNGIVTVVMKDGVILSKTGDTSLVRELSEAIDESSVYSLMNIPRQQEEVDCRKEEKEIAIKGIEFLRDHPEFIVQGDVAYLKGVKLELPAVVIATFAEIIANIDEATSSEAIQEWEKRFNALKMFWLQLALSPLEQCREDLLTFVTENDIRITPNGNLVLYRRIVKVGDTNKALTTFVSQQYYKVKKNKKSPKNYQVFSVSNDAETFEYILGNSIADPKVQSWNTQELKGTLYDLYHSLGENEDNKFTSWHKRGKHTIKVGTVYKIADKDINLDNGLCAAGGLHAAAVDYNYSSFGDTPVVVLVNPSKAITVPKGETGKLRTTEMFIVAVNDKPHGVHWDDDALAAVDEEYHQYTLSELEEILESKSFEKLMVEDNLPSVSIADIQSISAMLRNRVKPVEF